MKRKLSRYVSLYENSHSLLSSRGYDPYELERDDDLKLKSLLELVSEWSGPSMDPTMYVIFMKQRIGYLTKKVTRLQNTVDVWKNEVQAKDKEIKDMKWKVRFLKKKSPF